MFDHVFNDTRINNKITQLVTHVHSVYEMLMYVYVNTEKKTLLLICELFDYSFNSVWKSIQCHIKYLAKFHEKTI